MQNLCVIGNRFLFLAVLISLSFVTLNCGGGIGSGAGNTLSSGTTGTTGTAGTTAQSGSSGSVITATAGRWAASPSAIVFGNVLVGSTNSQSIQLSNSGSSAVTITSASSSGPGFSISGINLPMTLSSGQSITFAVSFAPSNSGAASGTLWLTDSTSQATGITLSGTAVDPIAHSIRLSWSPSSSTVVGYNVYRSARAGGPYTRNNPTLNTGTMYRDANVASGQTYYYVVTAVNSQNQESGYSQEAMAVVPIP